MSLEIYYKERKDFHYYKKVEALLSSLSFDSILDVGARRSPVLENIKGPIEKVLLDKYEIPPLEGFHIITSDFYTWIPDKHYDIVLCLQVLEHLENPEAFAEKLFTIAKKTVILSVPYKWKKGKCKYHIQDPVDMEKLKSWTNREPSESYIINDGLERLICVYHT